MTYSAGDLKGLINLIDKIKTKTFDINTQYKFLKISKVAKEEFELLGEQQSLLLQEYGEKDADGKYVINEDGGFKIKTELIQECAAKVNELNTHPVQFPDIYFSLDEFDNLGFTLEDLELLDPFIK